MPVTTMRTIRRTTRNPLASQPDGRGIPQEPLGRESQFGILNAPEVVSNVLRLTCAPTRSSLALIAARQVLLLCQSYTAMATGSVLKHGVTTRPALAFSVLSNVLNTTLASCRFRQRSASR